MAGHLPLWPNRYFGLSHRIFPKVSAPVAWPEFAALIRGTYSSAGYLPPFQQAAVGLTCCLMFGFAFVVILIRSNWRRTRLCVKTKKSRFPIAIKVCCQSFLRGNLRHICCTSTVVRGQTVVWRHSFTATEGIEDRASVL